MPFSQFVKKLLGFLFFGDQTKVKRTINKFYRVCEVEILFSLFRDQNYSARQTWASTASFPVTTLLPYTNPNCKSTIWALKYNNDPRAKANLVQLLLDELIALLTDRLIYSMNPTDIHIICIPSSSYHTGTRDYDQMHEIVLTLGLHKEAQQFFTYIPHAFVSANQTSAPTAKAQHVLTRKERIASVSKRFVLSAAIEEHQLLELAHILILDDVCTTGATFSHAYRLCMNAGAQSVHCIALSH